MSRARDLASSGVTSTVLSAKAPLASPDFTGTVDLTGTTISLDNDQISGDKVSGGTIGAGTFNGTIGDSASFPSAIILQMERVQSLSSGTITGTSNTYGQMTSLSVTAKKDNPSYFIIYIFTAKNTYTFMNTGCRIRAEVSASSVITSGSNYSSNAGNYQTPNWSSAENNTGDYRDQTGTAKIVTNASAGDVIAIYLDLFHNSGVSTTSTFYNASFTVFEF